MSVPPKKVIGEEFGWKCPQCGSRLPDSTAMVASKILNEKHLPRCKKWLSSLQASSTTS